MTDQKSTSCIDLHTGEMVIAQIALESILSLVQAFWFYFKTIINKITWMAQRYLNFRFWEIT